MLLLMRSKVVFKPHRLAEYLVHHRNITVTLYLLDVRRYVTPDSPAVLPSITNKSLMELAADEGMTVERRRVSMSEVADFTEVPQDQIALRSLLQN